MKQKSLSTKKGVLLYTQASWPLGRNQIYKKCGDPHTVDRAAFQAISHYEHSGRGRAQERPRHHTPQAGNANPTQAPPEAERSASKCRVAHTESKEPKKRGQDQRCQWRAQGAGGRGALGRPRKALVSVAQEPKGKKHPAARQDRAPTPSRPEKQNKKAPGERAGGEGEGERGLNVRQNA